MHNFQEDTKAVLKSFLIFSSAYNYWGLQLLVQ